MCEYCKNNMEGESLNPEWKCIDLIVDNSFLYAYCDCGYHNITKITYCPMCRKKIRLGGYKTNMNIEETYNIHKKINCIFPKLKLKFLCKKGIHNYQVYSEKNIHPITKIGKKSRITYYQIEWKTGLKCACCGRLEDIKQI